MTQLIETINRIHSLANIIMQRKQEGIPPYLLLLGAGASVASGSKLTLDIIDEVLKDHSGIDPSTLASDQKSSAYYSVLEGMSERDRYAILAKYIRGKAPSAGYRHLAELVRTDYFRHILTTNFDFLLESAFIDVGLRPDEVGVLINGQDIKERIIEVWNASTPRVKLLKHHGDIVFNILTFTPEELARAPAGIELKLKEILNDDLLIVGHSLHDPDLEESIKIGRGSLWYVNLSEPSDTDSARSIINQRGKVDHMILGELGRFDQFFAWLRLELILCEPEATVLREAQDLLTQLNTYRKQGNLTSLAVEYENLATLYDESVQNERAEMCFDRSAALWELIGDRKSASRLYLRLGNLHAKLQRKAPALRCYRYARNLAKAANDEHGLAQALLAIGQWYWKARYSQGPEHLSKERLEKAILNWKECLPLLRKYDRAEALFIEESLVGAQKLFKSL